MACTALAIAAPAAAQNLVLSGETILDATTFAAARKEGKVVVYGVYPETGMDPIRAAFKKETGVEVDYIRLTTQRMHPRIRSEHAAGKLEADFVDLSDLPLVGDLVEAGVLTRPHKVPAFDRIAPALKDPQGRWYTFLRPCGSLILNTARVPNVADHPTSWLDALDPKWGGGRIGMATIDAGGSAFGVYWFLRDVVAPDYWTRLAALKPRVYPGALPVATDLVRGETALIYGGATTVAEQIAAGAPVKIVHPKEGIPCYPDAGGITVKAPRPNAATLWLNYLMSAHGGKVIAGTGALASHPDAPRPSPAGTPLPASVKVWDMEIAAWTAKRESYSVAWRTTFGVK